ncbi:MAG: response regulator [Burkholderiales bacterium]|nr:response regulator [Burkholderiales bacterium]
MGILYVEDNDDLRDLISLLLAGEDREMVTCTNGEEALAALEQRTFDILVTDVSLPGLSGTDLARHVLAAKPETWVVLCSGYEFRQGLHHLGPNVRALLKPFEFETLEALIDEIITAVRAAEA